MFECTMPQYTITIDGYESGLTEKTVEQMIREQFAYENVEIHVAEDQSDISVNLTGYFTTAADGTEQIEQIRYEDNGAEVDSGVVYLSDLLPRDVVETDTAHRLSVKVTATPVEDPNA
jgi:hypothetical protein